MSMKIKNFFRKAVPISGKIIDVSCGIVISAILLAVIAVLVIFAIVTYFQVYRTVKIDSSDSPDGQYTLLFDQVGADVKEGDSHGARFKLKKGSTTITEDKVTVFQTEFTPDSWSVKWYDDRVEIYISPENTVEDNRNPIILYFDGRNFEARQVGNSVAPDGKYRVLFEQIGTDVTDGRSYEIRIKLVKDARIIIDRHIVAVNKEELSAEYWNVKWYDNRVEIYISSESVNYPLISLFFK